MTPEQIKEARKYLGFSFATDMAQALGVNIGTYHKWEAGKRKIPAVGIRAIKSLKFLHDANLLNSFLSVTNTPNQTNNVINQ